MRKYHHILLSVLFSNISGALIVFFYFAHIDIQTYVQNKLFWRGTQADWTTFTVVLILGNVATWLIGMRRARPLYSWEKRVREGEDPNIIPKQIRVWAVSYPLYLAITSLLILSIIGIFFGQGGLMIGTSDMQTFMLTFLGVGAVGGVSAFMLTFVSSDTQWRSHLPTFLADVKIKSLSTPHITVGLRLITTLISMGIVPLGLST